MKNLLKLTMFTSLIFLFIACGGGEYIEEEEIISTINFRTFVCNEEWSESNLAGHTVADYITITIYRKANDGFHEVGKVKSNNKGEATYKTINEIDNFYYRAEKVIDNAKLYTNLDQYDFIIDGVFTTQKSIDNYPEIGLTNHRAVLGGIKLKDFNGDGIIDDNDKVDDGYVPLDIKRGYTVTEIIYLITRNYYAPGPGEPI